MKRKILVNINISVYKLLTISLCIKNILLIIDNPVTLATAAVQNLVLTSELTFNLRTHTDKTN